MELKIQKAKKDDSKVKEIVKKSKEEVKTEQRLEKKDTIKDGKQDKVKAGPKDEDKKLDREITSKELSQDSGK